MKTFYLARHGETQWNQVGRLQGQSDSALTELGRQQMEGLASRLQSVGIEHILTSSLGRAMASAAICASRLAVQCTQADGLAERHFGAWQGQDIDQLKQSHSFEHVFAHRLHNAPSGGEGAIPCARRFHQSLVSLATQSVHSCFLVISHGEALAHFLCRYLHVAYQSLELGNGSVVKVSYSLSRQDYQFGAM